MTAIALLSILTLVGCYSGGATFSQPLGQNGAVAGGSGDRYKEVPHGYGSLGRVGSR